MPIFEYECRSCGTKFEQLIYGSGESAVCRKCGSADILQLLSTFAVSAGSDKAKAELGPCGACGAAQRGACGIE